MVWTIWHSFKVERGIRVSDNVERERELGYKFHQTARITPHKKREKTKIGFLNFNSYVAVLGIGGIYHCK